MKNRSHLSQILSLLGLLIAVALATSTDENQIPGIIVRRFSDSGSSGGPLLRLTQNGHEEVVHVAREPLFTLKSEPVKVQSDFKTVDISVIHRQRDRENAKKIAIVQEDLQSRVKVDEPESKTEKRVEEAPEPEPVNPEELLKKQARVKEDIESRVFFDEGLFQHSERAEKSHYPVKRSDEDYYAEEPDRRQQSRMTTEQAKEEDSFFSIFESLFGSSDDESQSKKKSKPEDEPMFKGPEDTSMEENIKTVGDILKPLKPVVEPVPETPNVFTGYQSDTPEYRIVNNFHGGQSHKQGLKPPELKPSYHNFYRPTEKPFRPYKLHSTNGYEDYDLEEFLDKDESTTIRVKHVSPMATTSGIRNDPTTKISTTAAAITTTTTSKTTTKNVYESKLKFPSVQKKNDYINRNRYQEVKEEATDRRPEKMTERTTHQKPDTKTTTEIVNHFSRPSFETKINEVKPQKIQESPNFYNLINLPVRYSTKDTAIPLISTSYANTKIQGMGAHKYEKGANGKYPNHKYDQVTTVATKRPSYWVTRRTSTEKATATFRPSPPISSTVKHSTWNDLEKGDFDDVAMGLGPEFGGYGSKTSAEVKTEISTLKAPTTVFYKETTFGRIDEGKTETGAPQQSPGAASDSGQGNIRIKEIEKIPEKTSSKPAKEVYEEYDYDSFPARVQEVRPSIQNQNNAAQINFEGSEHEQKKNELEYKTQYPKGEGSVPSAAEREKLPEVPEYEYYDYEDISTTVPTTTTTTPKFKIKYPSLSKDKIKASGGEKVAVVVPSQDHDFYEKLSPPENAKTSTTDRTPVKTTAATTTTTAATPPKTSQPATKATTELQNQFTKPITQFYKPNQFYKEPAPVFEDVKEQEDYASTKKATTEKPKTATEATVQPVIVTSGNKEQEGNVNIVLVPAKEAVKAEPEEKYSHPEPSSPTSVHKVHARPGGSYQSGYGYTTEFTLGVMQGGNSGAQKTGNSATIQGGHFVASSIPTSPYGNDEPFRPIPKPPGITSTFHIVREDVPKPPSKNPAAFQNKHPLPTPPPTEETEPVHEPHEFIPSPQFHRPADPKPAGEGRPSPDLDYDFEGIQTEPKPGQYVIFSKPQLNPEMNENQLKKKPEINGPSKVVSNVPHYQEKINQLGQESQKHVAFKEGPIFQNAGKLRPSASDKTEGGRPLYGVAPEINDDRLSLQLVPPRGTQTEKPFEGNFVVPEPEKQGSTVSYPRPHWEKNGKPSFLLNALPNKNELHGSRFPPMPPQMAPTLIPPSSIPPQRFRRPVPPHVPPMRKNFNEAGTNVKPKPNLPNILPQFRPNAKVGGGSYHRPPGYGNSNRRNGLNRYREKEHGNFPYHIQHPDKDVSMHREYDSGPEVVPKFITNRGKIPSEPWNPQGMQKRFGQGPTNINSKSENPGRPAKNEKVLRRMQRTPVTTLQMLKQMPGIKTQKTQISREDGADPSAPLVPPIYKTFVDQPKNKENLYIVYPAKAPQKLQPDNTKVFIVSDAKSQKKFYNFTKPEDRHPLLGPNKKPNPFGDKSKNDFPYGFVKPDDRIKPIGKQQQKEKEEEKNARAEGVEGVEGAGGERGSGHKHRVFPAPAEKDDKIDMNLHMQSNNQWNEVRSSPGPGDKVRGDHYRFSEASQKQSEKNGIRANPPSEYHTSIKDERDSAFTLGAVMHTVSEAKGKGQAAAVSLRDDQKEPNPPKLNVNERIANGKIITVSMPLDVKEEPNESKNQFRAPFQASSSVTSEESHPANAGWTIVKSPDDGPEPEDGKETTRQPADPHFSFENFKPELIGGFKPIYELPEQPEDEQTKDQDREKPVDREEKTLRGR